MISPAGAATATALASTKTVLPSTERTMTSPMRGQRYGGSSRTNDDGIPFRTVLDKRRDIRSVITIPSTITAVSMSAEMTDELPPKEKNIVIIAISVGKRPLQGTKQFVNMAMRRSRGESMMRQPVTPQALQPEAHHPLSGTACRMRVHGGMLCPY